MHLLEAGMAFAVVMIVFATITAGIVEIFVRILGWRGKFLERAVKEHFETIVWPRLKNHFASGEDAHKEVLDDFLEQLLRNPASANNLGSKMARDKQISVLSIVAFAQRLGRTKIGEKILSEGEEQLDLIIRDFVRCFDRFNLAASEVYRRNTQLVALCFGIILAIIANVDVLRVSSAILQDPDLRAGLIKEAEEAQAADQAAVGELEKAQAALKNGAVDQKDVGKLIEAARDKIESARESAKELREIGLPIGTEYFPHCHLFGHSDKDSGNCKAWQTDAVGIGKLLKWLLMTVIAGVLIGLGGPFWFRVFSGLSHLAQLLKTFGLSSAQPEAKPEEVTPTKKVIDSAAPVNIVDAFKTSAKVHSKSVKVAPKGRAFLNDDGTPATGEQS